MKESVSIKWDGGMSFEANVMDYKIMMDAELEFGGQKRGPKPKPLLLVALAGCTGMDIVSLLNKMRVDFKKFNIRVDGDTADEHPKRFTKITVTYEVTGKNIDREKVEKAVVLSKEKYCSVSATLKDSVDIDYIIEVKEE
jgi:putative redox protein